MIAIFLPTWYFFGIVRIEGVEMTYFLGIDGGGSGCRAAIVAADGLCLGTAQGGPANVATDINETVSNILQVTSASLAAAGLSMEIGALAACIGLAGANAAGIEGQLRSQLPFRNFRLVTDAETTAKGALGQKDGLVAAIGTGSVFVVQQDGRQRTFGGWGFALGDEGSGARMGQALLSRTVQSVDGRRDCGELFQTVLKEFGGAEGVVAYAAKARPADFAALVPRVLSSSDTQAVAIRNEFVSEVAEMIAFLQPDPPLPVVFSGGLGPFYAQLLADRWNVIPACGSALDGAVLMAREMA